MKKYYNNQYVEMTAEEIAALEAECANMPPPEPTPEERIAVLEAEIAELKALTNK
ncbi:MAG: hypothetical protein VB118_02950 [Oscillospiraceae bacterium]|nr:hypothetical protein [Oscillospiraceae bacterium]